MYFLISGLKGFKRTTVSEALLLAIQYLKLKVENKMNSPRFSLFKLGLVAGSEIN